jgi:peptide/nickel transport system ATP-binding protein
LGAVPKLGSSLVEGGRGKLAEIPGLVPSLRQKIVGCPFAGRCPLVTDICRQVAPAIEPKAAAHVVACHHVEQRMAA